MQSLSLRSLLALGLSLASLAFPQGVRFLADRSNGLYRVGEKATFTLSAVTSNGAPVTEGTVAIRVDNFGAKEITNFEVDLATAKDLRVAAGLSEPGFLRVAATLRSGKVTNRKIASAAFEPEKIRAASARPADFDAFWNESLATYAKTVPDDVRFEALPEKSDSNHASFRVSAATYGGARVWGFLTVPKVGKGPFPVVVTVPGAGPGVISGNTGLADKGVISLVMNVHPFEPATNAADQKKLYEEQDKAVQSTFGAKRYAQAGATNRQTYFYFRMILGMNRIVDAVSKRPGVDASRFFYSGTSQGGGFGFFLVGLNPRFKKATFYVSALTDLLGFQAGRMSGWPRLVEGVRAEDAAAATAVAPYFDGSHFAARITCPVRCAVGFIDEVCPPAAVYSSYNALASRDKAILHGLTMAHPVLPAFYEAHDTRWLLGMEKP